MMTLAQYMQREGLTDAAMAGLVGCDRTHILRLRRNISWPGRDIAHAIYQLSGGEVVFIPTADGAARSASRPRAATQFPSEASA